MIPITSSSGGRARATRSLVRLLVVLCALLAASVAARAQSPKLGGDFYTDETNFGFKVGYPAGWEFVPPSPDDGNLIAKFVPKSGGSVIVSGKTGTTLNLEAWILKFDRRAKAKAVEGEMTRRQSTVKDLPSWVKGNLMPGFVEDPKRRKEVEVAKIPATEQVFMRSSGGFDIGLYAMVYKLSAEVDIAVLYIAPGDASKWSKYEPEFKKLARSFKPLGVKAGKQVVAAGETLRDRKRAMLQKETANQGDWKLFESENYFVVTNNDDKEFINELMKRLEAIRRVYELDYPPSMVAEIRASAARTGDAFGGKPGEGKPGEGKPGKDGKPGEDGGDGEPGGDAEPAVRPPSGGAPKEPAVDPVEASRTSVVRVCKNKEQYVSYGGSPSSAGFWYSVTEELVLFDDKVGGRSDTWAVLNHEAFHQYIYYFYGNIAPHSWYNEGTGDFYSGYKYNRNGTFTLDKFSWRVGTIQEALGQGKFVPLADFVRLTQPEYYGKNKWDLDGFHNYAQGWSFVYFLRTGKKANARGWNPRWDTILDDYLRALASSGKVEQAVEQAFTGVDMEELQQAWIAYTK